MWPAGRLLPVACNAGLSGRRPPPARVTGTEPSIDHATEQKGGRGRSRAATPTPSRAVGTGNLRPGDRRISGRQSQPRPCTAPAGRRRHPRTRGAPPPTGPAVGGSDQAVTPARRTHRTQAKRSRARLWTKPSALASCPGRSGRAAPATGGTVREKTCGCVNAQRLLGY
ncbi:hypothetical protein PVAP13_2NG404303 [Panicum virgatum]|uniref:Uncharacterized protein n=1 Tax=Panicum virgatum TaxID=38727 RepID=A0A8T0VHZ5_PANVG|nr:hypothetical protein PVAP13_2NG404303 [Panicum virgatum]